MNKKFSYFLPYSPFQDLSGFCNDHQSRYPADWVYRPLGMELEITAACNLGCAGCAVEKSANVLSTEIIEKIFAGVAGTGIAFYTLTGGEPFQSFDRLLEIIKIAPLDLYKINTNGFAFDTIQNTEKLLTRLYFSTHNRFLKPGLYISQGQQNIAGIPLLNSIYALVSALTLLDPERFFITLANFDYNPENMEKIEKEFQLLLDKYQLPLNLFDFHFIKIVDPVLCSTAIRKSTRDNEETGLEMLVERFNERILNCSPQAVINNNDYLGPRLFVRANGDVFACPGFSLVHRIGNIRTESLEGILYNANQSKIIRRLFSGGLPALYKEMQRSSPTLANRSLNSLSGPCNICAYLKNC